MTDTKPNDHDTFIRQGSIPNKLSFLSEPFEWVYIPGGLVNLKYPYTGVESLVLGVEPFYIAKYPITNAQYKIYVQETGRQPETHYWHDSRFTQPLQPMYNVRWHEAMLFCQWVSAKAGHLITLPTNAQWQRAAQGDDSRKYPWGNDWDSSRCNTEASGIWHTTPVTQYPQGASPYGVMDMIGNVFEWCLTDADTGVNSLDFGMPDSTKFDQDQRIFKGSCYASSRIDVISSGAISMHWGFYDCGIRLVTASNPLKSL